MENCVESSEATGIYNCAAWAADDTNAKWWPDPEDPDYYWPEGARRDDSLESFIEGFGTLDYEPCADGTLEPAFAKIAVYATGDPPEPTHVTRQLPDGRWTSKIGDREDVEHHTLRDIAAGLYGQPVLYMRRPRAT